ncbi:hypothetical protein [Halorubellus sp. PRR65]|uniref:DUF7546 family protein n=1 Tax=Halorubellus sp. PRR65 TaxID=3098148 RepID=UPI002B25DCDD|nr:hypothetical protein [Halorubellus sp. PRR65]
MTEESADRIDRAIDRGADALAASTPWLALAVVLLLGVTAYAVLADVSLTRPRYAFYPVVWVVVGAAAVSRAPRAVGSARRRALAGTVATAYLGVLLWFTGSVYVMPEWMYSLSVFTDGLPGWAPIVTFMVGPVGGSVVPFVLVGYVVLAYLTYVSLTRATRGLAAAVLGPVTCVGCVAAGVSGLLALAGGTGATVAVAGASGGAGGLATVAYDAATAVYLVAVTALATID